MTTTQSAQGNEEVQQQEQAIGASQQFIFRERLVFQHENQLRKIIGSLVSLFASLLAFQAGLWFYDTLKWNGSTTMYLPWLWNVTLTNRNIGNILYYMMDGAVIWAIVSAICLGIFLSPLFVRRIQE